MRGVLTDGLLGLACLAAASCMGCASSMTVAFGKDARAAIYTPPVCPPSQPAQAIGTKTTKVVERDGKVGPDDVVTRVTTEPVLAPQPVPVQESKGAALSEAGGKVLGGAFNILKVIGCVATLGTVCGF